MALGAVLGWHLRPDGSRPDEFDEDSLLYKIGTIAGDSVYRLRKLHAVFRVAMTSLGATAVEADAWREAVQGPYNDIEDEFITLLGLKDFMYEDALGLPPTMYDGVPSQVFLHDQTFWYGTFIVKHGEVGMTIDDQLDGGQHRVWMCQLGWRLAAALVDNQIVERSAPTRQERRTSVSAAVPCS